MPLFFLKAISILKRGLSLAEHRLGEHRLAEHSASH